MTVIELPDQIAEVKREIAMRKRVYPKWIAANPLVWVVSFKRFNKEGTQC